MLLSTLQFLLFNRIFPYSASVSPVEKVSSLAVRAESSENAYIEHFRTGSSKQRYAFHSVALLKDHIYIEGGQLSSIIDGNQTNSDLAPKPNRTYSFPVNKAWTAETIEFNEIFYPSGMGYANFIGLWADETRNALYRWGGLLKKGHTNQLFRMEPDNNGGGIWAEKIPTNTDTYLNLMASEMGATTFCGDVGIYVGGQASLGLADGSDMTPSPGVRMYNATSMMCYNDTETNTNEFNDDIKSGEAVCLPGFREQPLMMVLGGRRSSVASYIPMKTVSIYDPVSQTWHQQQTISDNGEYPGTREGACVVSVQGKNNTLEIFMSGGIKGDNPESAVYSDIWVLSLPAFKWFSMAATLPEARQMHRCVVAGKRQMISVGGLSIIGMDGFRKPDQWSRGIGIFDLVDLQWKSSFDPNLGEYDSPEVVKEWYSSGNADNVKYTEGLKSIFQKAGTTTNGGNMGDQESKSSTNIAGIAAGASVGGVAVIALAVGLFWFLRRRRQRRSGQKPEQQEEAAYLPAATNKGGSSVASTYGPELDSMARMEVECQQASRDFMKASPHLSELHEEATFAEMDATPRLR